MALAEEAAGQVPVGSSEAAQHAAERRPSAAARRGTAPPRHRVGDQTPYALMTVTSVLTPLLRTALTRSDM